MDEQQQTPQPNTPPTVPLHKDSFLHSHLLAEIISILVIAAGVGIVFYFKASAPVVNLETVQHIAKTDPTAGWKNYTDPVLNFSFKYPEGVGYLSPEGLAYKGELNNELAGKLTLILGTKEEPVLVFQIDQLTNDLNNKNIWNSPVETNINGSVFMKYTGIKEASDEVYTISRNNHKYVIAVAGQSQVGYQILSTLKFVTNDGFIDLIPDYSLEKQCPYQPEDSFFETTNVAHCKIDDNSEIMDVFDGQGNQTAKYIDKSLNKEINIGTYTIRTAGGPTGLNYNLENGFLVINKGDGDGPWWYSEGVVVNRTNFDIIKFSYSNSPELHLEKNGKKYTISLSTQNSKNDSGQDILLANSIVINGVFIEKFSTPMSSGDYESFPDFQDIRVNPELTKIKFDWNSKDYEIELK